MKKSKISFWVFFVLGMTVGCLVNAKEPANKLPSQNPAHSLVWEITGPGIEQPSYLAGTMHIMCRDGFKLDQRFIDGINQTEQLVGEIDMDDLAEKQVMQASIFADKSLKERMSEPQYEQFEDIFESITELDLETFDRMSFVSINSLMAMAQFPCQEKMMFENELVALASADGKDILGLESVSDQLDAFKAMFPDYGEVMTDEQVALIKDGVNQTKIMLDLFVNEDVQGLYEHIAESFAMMDADNEAKVAMLDRRNQNWVKIIPQMVTETPSFIAVGAGHLGGDQGVIQLLREQGLTLKPVQK